LRLPGKDTGQTGQTSKQKEECDNTQPDNPCGRREDALGRECAVGFGNPHSAFYQLGDYWNEPRRRPAD